MFSKAGLEQREKPNPLMWWKSNVSFGDRYNDNVLAKALAKAEAAASASGSAAGLAVGDEALEAALAKQRPKCFL